MNFSNEFINMNESVNQKILIPPFPSLSEDNLGAIDANAYDINFDASNYLASTNLRAEAPPFCAFANNELSMKNEIGHSSQYPGMDISISRYS
jgi:hypothetical protein